MIKKAILWLLSHIYIRRVDLQSKSDDVAYDETKPHTATQIGIRGTF